MYCSWSAPLERKTSMGMVIKFKKTYSHWLAWTTNAPFYNLLATELGFALHCLWIAAALKGFYLVPAKTKWNNNNKKSNRGAVGIKTASEGLILHLLRLTRVLPLSTERSEFNLRTFKSEWTTTLFLPSMTERASLLTSAPQRELKLRKIGQKVIYFSFSTESQTACLNLASFG